MGRNGENGGGGAGARTAEPGVRRLLRVCCSAGGDVHIEPRYRQFPELTRLQVVRSELLSGFMWFWILWHFWHSSDSVLVRPGVTAGGCGAVPGAGSEGVSWRRAISRTPTPRPGRMRSSASRPTTLSRHRSRRGEGRGGFCALAVSPGVPC